MDLAPGNLSRTHKQLLLVGGLLVFALLASGCVERTDWEAVQRQATTPAGDLYADHTVGQTLVADHAGMSSIEVVLVDYGPDSSRQAAPLELRLCRDLSCQDVVTQTMVPVEAISHNQSYRLTFPPQPDSAGRTYTLLAAAPQAAAAARVTLWANPADVYPAGTLLRDGQPAPGDLNFWTYYDTGGVAVAGELLRQAALGLPHLPGLLLLFLAPGYLLARLLPRSRQDDLLDLLGICLALSVAAVPVLLLVLSYLGVWWGGLVVPVCAALLGALALGLLIWDLRRGHWRGVRWGGAPLLVAMVGTTAIALVLRAFHALDLAGPLWVDAVHHTLLARIIVERGAIPADYLPYVQVAPATYHFGFQSLIVVLHGLTGLPLPGALLLLGQALSGLSGLPLYVLGKRWGGSPWAGLAAAAIPAVFSLMPAYYVSWSRYTELAGLFILPVAAVLLDRLLRRKHWHWGLAGVTAVAVAGLLVTHVRVAAFLAALALLLWLRATLRWRAQDGRLWIPAVRALGVGVVAVGLTWAWLWPSVQSLWLPAVQKWLPSEEVLSLFYVLFGPGGKIFPVVLVGLVLALLWRREEALMLFLWVGLLLVLAKPAMLGLHVAALIDATAVAIALYVPLSMGAALAGGGLAVLARRVSWLRPWWRWAGAALLLTLSLWGAYQLRGIVNSRTAILARADLKAMAWIEGNTPPGALFLINSYQWMTATYAGNDGGYWIEPLTGRRTWPPPALYALGTDDYINEINQVAQQAMDSSGGEALYTLLREHGITHVYLGRYGAPMAPEELLSYSGFRKIYQEDGVWIFSLEP